MMDYKTGCLFLIINAPAVEKPHVVTWDYDGLVCDGLITFVCLFGLPVGVGK